jgi:hypothetical protein
MLPEPATASVIAITFWFFGEWALRLFLQLEARALPAAVTGGPLAKIGGRPAEALVFAVNLGFLLGGISNCIRLLFYDVNLWLTPAAGFGRQAHNL